MDTAVSLNKSGQALGRKGRRTRSNIVEGLKALLAKAPIAGVTVAAVAAEANISAPTFYLYFEDLGEVLLAALEEVEPDLAAIRETLEPEWPPERTFACAEAFIQAYHDLWTKHGPILQARNVLAEQGDPRFMAHRHDGPRGLAHLLAGKMRVIHRQDTPRPVEPNGMTAILITALERISTLLAQEYYAPGVINWERSRHALAHFIAESIQPS
jgi:AcrR family transcriptional regulator